MAVYKEQKTNTWKVYYRYTDWQGNRKQTTKRGFAKKKKHKLGSEIKSTKYNLILT